MDRIVKKILKQTNMAFSSIERQEDVKNHRIKISFFLSHEIHAFQAFNIVKHTRETFDDVVHGK